MLLPFAAAATEFTSTNFKVIDPVISIGGGRSTSSSFQLERSVGQPAIGISDSASFQVKGGFLYFPEPAAAEEAPAPTPTPAAGGGPIRFPIALPIVFPPLFPPLEIPLVCPAGTRLTDLNCDGSIGLQDLSIFLFFGVALAPNRADFNQDAAVDTRDLSILFTDWTERLLAFVPEEQFEIFTERRAQPGPRSQFAIIGEAAAPERAAAAEQQRAVGVFERLGRIFTIIFEKARNWLYGFLP